MADRLAPTSRRRRTVLLGAAAVALVLVVVAVASCGEDDEVSPGTSAGPAVTAPGTFPQGTAAPGELSIVVLGDSVAAGEGIDYGYTYEVEEIAYFSGWSGGTDDPAWEGEYPDCHQSTQAYGDVVAASLGAQLTKLACTGSTYENGIVGPRVVGTTTFRPAQFGDWATRTDLDPAYDAAAPDVVVVTLGADDLSFVDVVTYCATGTTDLSQASLESFLASEQPRRELRAAFRRWLEGVRSSGEAPPEPSGPGGTAAAGPTLTTDPDAPYCTERNPGGPIERLFWEPIDSGQLADHYRALVAAIQARGADPAFGGGKVPQIVFTTYHRPLPTDAESDWCLDTGDLSRQELDYLTSLQARLDQEIHDAVGDLEGVHVADLSQVMAGHEWCTEDPWTYGLSALLLDSETQAPFHPTPEGQAAIATVVEQTIRQALAG